MPEGDTIHYHANRIRPLLAGHVPDALETPHPRFARDRWPERLRGRAVTGVDARGKHLFVRFEGDLVIHSHPRIARLGPDILAEEFDAPRFLRRLRGDDPTRPIGDALLDQTTIAGIGNLWKAEGCFDAAIDPWRPTGRVADDEALAIVAAARP